MHCECNQPSVEHAANVCATSYGLRRFRRGDQELLLCGDCYLSNDVLLDRELDDD